MYEARGASLRGLAEEERAKVTRHREELLDGTQPIQIVYGSCAFFMFIVKKKLMITMFFEKSIWECCQEFETDLGDFLYRS